MRFEIYESPWDGQWYWRLKAQNGRIICDGAEGYCSKWNAKRAARRTRYLMILDGPIVEVER